jgi:hypothetical protein
MQRVTVAVDDHVARVVVDRLTAPVDGWDAATGASPDDVPVHDVDLTER